MKGWLVLVIGEALLDYNRFRHDRAASNYCCAAFIRLATSLLGVSAISVEG